MLIHTPHRNKAEGTRRTIELVEASALAPGTVLIDHNNELTVHDVLASELLGGLLIYPGTKMDEHRMVRIIDEHGPERIIVNSACDWGVSDPLKVPKTAARCAPRATTTTRSTASSGATPHRVAGATGHLMLDELEEREPTATFEDSGVLRGEQE